MGRLTRGGSLAKRVSCASAAQVPKEAQLDVFFPTGSTVCLKKRKKQAHKRVLRCSLLGSRYFGRDVGDRVVFGSAKPVVARPSKIGAYLGILRPTDLKPMHVLEIPFLCCASCVFCVLCWPLCTTRSICSPSKDAFVASSIARPATTAIRSPWSCRPKEQNYQK